MLDSEVRHGRVFGNGTFLGNSGDNFLEKPIEQQVIEMGWSHACPIVDKVAEQFGHEWTLRRYSECNFTYGLILESAKENNPELYKQLNTPIERLKDEPTDVITKFTPEIYKNMIYPLSTPWGYALPRVAIEEMGRGNENKDRTSEKLIKTLNIIDEAVKKSKNPIELVVRISEKVSKNDADPREILSHLLSKAVLQETNCKKMFNCIIKEMRKSAPILTTAYDEMSSSTKSKLEIIEFK